MRIFLPCGGKEEMCAPLCSPGRRTPNNVLDTPKRQSKIWPKVKANFMGNSGHNQSMCHDETNNWHPFCVSDLDLIEKVLTKNRLLTSDTANDLVRNH